MTPTPAHATPDFTLTGRRALVTGAGRGLGRACAIGLAAAGAEVVLTSRTRRELEEVAAEIGAAGGRAVVRPADVRDARQVAALLGEHAVDVVLVNAGTNEPGPFVDVTEESLDRMLTLNVRAAFLVAQAAARRMLAEGRPGTLLFMSSQMGHVGASSRSVYCATKHAIEGLVKALAAELGPSGIRVASVAPTFVRTPMTEPFLADAAFARDVVGRIPLGRLGDVADVVAAVVFLASPAAALITGTSLVVDGGWTAT